MTAKIKLNSASGGGSFSLQAPSSSSNNRVFTLPDIADATMATVNGITEADSWYLTSSLSGSADPIQSNLSRCSIAADGFSKLGTGMTVSSGIWTFPSTGFWTVQAQAEIELASGRASRYNQLEIQVTEDNSQFLKVARGNSWFDDYGTARVSGSSVVAIIDCVNTSNVKVKFSFAADDSQAVLVGSGSIYKTRFNFIRLSDT